MGMGVAAQTVLRFEQDHFVFARKQPGGTETCDAATHHGDLHDACRAFRRDAGIDFRSQTRPNTAIRRSA